LMMRLASGFIVVAPRMITLMMHHVRTNVY
jgi:hypothetical protein